MGTSWLNKHQKRARDSVLIYLQVQLMRSKRPAFKSATMAIRLPNSFNWVHNCNLTRNQKKTTPAGKRTCLLPVLSCAVNHLSNVGKNRAVAAFRLCSPHRKKRPGTAAHSSTKRRAGETGRKRPSVPRYLNE